jgi:hypothetical protein
MNEIKEAFLSNVIEKDQEIKGVNVKSYIDLFTDQEYVLDGRSETYFMKGVEAVFNFMETIEERVLAKRALEGETV